MLGQVFERSNILERLHKLDLEKLKQKTESKLKVLCKRYGDANENLEFPEGLCFKHIIEHAFIIDEPIQDQILGLNPYPTS